MNCGPIEFEAPRSAASTLPAWLQPLTPWVEAGLREDMSLALQKKVRITNVIGMVSAVAMLFYWPVDILSGMGWLTLPMVLVNLAFLLVPVINRRGHHLASRLLIATAMNAGIAFYFAAYGYAIGMQFFLVCSICLAVTVFLRSERGAFLYALGLPVVVGLGVAGYLLVGTPFAEPLSPFWENLLATSNAVVASCIMMALLAYIIIQNDRNEEELALQSARYQDLYLQAEEVNAKLEASRKDLQSQQEQLAAANEELQSQQEELAAANEELRAQQEQLSSTNDELREHSLLLERANQEISRKAEEVARASRIKSEFLANMSHELRTPLNSMLLLSQDLADNPKAHLDEDEVQCARIVHEAGRDLLGLINDILDLSKVEAGKIELNIEKVDLRALGATLARKYGPLAESKGLQLDIVLEKLQGHCIYTDSMRLQQVITNLISNALKFTEQGQVRVAFAQVEGESGQSDSLRVSVTDTGIGIPAEKLEKVFEVFEQADGSTSREYGGTGLGLSLSRKLTELMGGTLEVRSTVGTGSTFTLCLPMEKAEPAGKEAGMFAAAVECPDSGSAEVIEPACTLASDPAFVGRSLLIIDDDMRNLFSLARMLSRAGFQVYKASSAHCGMEILKSRADEISAVCMDIMMPEKDGHAAIVELRADPQFANLPIIAVTAKTMAGDQDRCLAVGASDYVAKPVDPQLLLDKLRALLVCNETLPVAL